ncbi:hypothetical protein AGMMS49928_12540 [Spirochaetia bacterium]|nr:hypothetical protein AGMMS49928_12540 [Spirochaetia bacterium]
MKAFAGKIFLMVIILIVNAVDNRALALDLDETRALALANSRTLAQYNLDLRSSVLNEKIQGYGMFPSLSLGASASANLESIEDSLKVGASIGLKQTIYDGGITSLKKSIAAISSETVRKETLAAYFMVLETADSYYYAALEAAAALDAAESSLATAALSLSLAEIRMQNRNISAGDYLEVMAEKEARETAKNQARRELSMARARLLDLTGLKELPDLEPVDFEIYEILFQKLALIDDSALDALHNFLWQEIAGRNPDLLKAGLNFQSAEANLKLAKKDYLPSLSASLSSGLNYAVGSGIAPVSGSLGLSLTVPLDFWVTAANVEKNKIALDKANLNYLNTGASVELELRGILINLAAQAGSILSAGKAWEYARSHFDYVMELFRLSQRSPSELSTAETLVRTNRNSFAGARYKFLQAFSTLRNLGSFDSTGDLMELLLRGLMQ